MTEAERTDDSETATEIGTMALGDSIRRAVLGDDHVERSRSNVTELSRPLQDLVTEFCWGAVWGRVGLERKTRSMLTIAMLAALNRQHELSVHVRGALRNGCTEADIHEVILHTAPYCGVPAALEATRTVQATFDQLDAGK
jgi:4-carboxymuconolactone decarboxylase